MSFVPTSECFAKCNLFCSCMYTNISFTNKYEGLLLSTLLMSYFYFKLSFFKMLKFKIHIINKSNIFWSLIFYLLLVDYLSNKKKNEVARSSSFLNIAISLMHCETLKISFACLGGYLHFKPVSEELINIIYSK